MNLSQWGISKTQKFKLEVNLLILKYNNNKLVNMSRKIIWLNKNEGDD